MYQPAASSTKPARPVPVTIASILLGLLALLTLASAIVTMIAVKAAEGRFRTLARREDLDAEEIDAAVTALRFGLICSAVVLVLFAALLAGLAWGVARGSQGARIVTWVVCGLGVLCGCCTGTGSIGSFNTGSPNGVDPDEVAGYLMVSSLPGWAGGTLLGSSALTVLGYIATAILLALPAANAFFRGNRSAGAWQPPTYPQNPPPNYPPPPAHPSHPAPPNEPNPPAPPPSTL